MLCVCVWEEDVCGRRKNGKGRKVGADEGGRRGGRMGKEAKGREGVEGGREREGRGGRGGRREIINLGN